jgi:hypothetical protein
MADFSEPQLSSTYTTFLSTLKARDTDLAALFAKDTVSTTNFPARAVRFNTDNDKFERRNSDNTDFEDLTTNFHFPAITIDGSGTLSVGGAITGASINVTGLVSGGRINATGNTPTQTGLYRPASNTLGITTNTTLRWAIDSAGRLFNNGQATHQGDSSSDLQIYNTAGGRIDLLREDATVVGGNALGQISAYTNETADASFLKAATIQFISDGTFSNTSHPTRIHFQTCGVNSTTPRTVAAFDQAGFFGLGENVGAAPSYPFHLNGGSTNNTAYFKSSDTNMFIGLSDDATTVPFNNRIAAIGNELQFRANGAATPHLALIDTFKVLIRKTSPALVSSGTNQAHNIQIYGTDGTAGLGVSRGSGNASPPSINLYKYRNTSYSHSQTAVIGDAFGDINWYASDGTQMQNVLRFRVNSFATDFSGNSTAVSTGAVPTGMNLRVLNNDGGNVTFFQVDHNGHIKLTPHAQPSGSPQNAYSLDIQANNTNGTGNFLRFTETDTTISAGRFIGGIQFASADTNAQNNGLLGEIRVSAESGNPVHGIMGIRMAGTEHITIEGLNNHLGIHRSDPEFPLDVVGNALFDGNVCISTDRAGFINANGNAALQVTGNTDTESMVNITRFGNVTGNYPTLTFTKNHSTSGAGNTACPDNSILGAVEFQGTRGSDFGVGARILAKTAAAFSSDPSPIRTTDLHFQVANGNNLNTLMVLHHGGALHLGDNNNLDTDYSNISDARLVVIDGSGADIVLHRRDGTTANGEGLGALQCSDSDGGLPAAPSAKIEFIASQAHSATAKGTDIRLGMCANGSTDITNRFTFRDSGAFGVNGDSVGSSGDCLISKGNAPPQYQPVAAKAWVHFDGDNFSMERQYNVSSVTDNGTGDYTVNWDTDFSTGNYAMVVSVSSSNHIPGDGHGVAYIMSQGGATARIRVNSEDGATAVMDKDIVNVVAFH